MSYLNNHKPHKNSQLWKVNYEKFQLEFIEHAVGFVCLTLLITTNRNVRDSILRCLRRETEPECANRSATETLL